MGVFFPTCCMMRKSWYGFMAASSRLCDDDWLRRCDSPRRVRGAKGGGRDAGARAGYKVIAPAQRPAA